MAGGHAGWLVGGGVLLVGAAAALPFYRGAIQPANRDASATTESVVPWDGDPLTLRVGSEPLPRSSTTQPLPEPAITRTSPLTDEPPKIDGEYGGLLDRFRSPAPPQEISSDPAVRALSISAASDEDREASAPVAARPTNSKTPHVAMRPALQDHVAPVTDDDEPVEKRHSIVDGDTLERIALRYYGDAFYARAIFDRNRKVLTDPELLPVGEQIVIPSRQAAMATPQLPLESLTLPDAQPHTQLEPLQ